MVLTEVPERLAEKEMVWWGKALSTKIDDLSLIPGSHLALPVGWHRGEQRHRQASVFARTLVHPRMHTHVMIALNLKTSKNKVSTKNPWACRIIFFFHGGCPS